MNTSIHTRVHTRIAALCLGLAAVLLGGCDQRPADNPVPPASTTTPAPMPPASAASG